jgi:hypothetical protein
MLFKKTRRNLKLVAYLRRRRFKNPIRTVAAIRKTKLNTAVALTVLEKESGKGRNIFGCDHGAGRAFCHQKVTRARVRALLGSGLMNGVGPTQLTWRPYVIRAQRRGGAHRPYINMVVGFGIFRDAIKNEGSVWAGAKAYNGSSSYADSFARKLAARGRSLRKAGF